MYINCEISHVRIYHLSLSYSAIAKYTCRRVCILDEKDSDQNGMIKAGLSMLANAKKELMLLGGTILIVLLIELFVFNSGIIMDQFSRLEEQRYTIHDGILHQMKLKNGQLSSRGPSPSIIFKDVNMPVDRILITCQNFKPQERGQVFFRGADENFTWLNSVSYETSTNVNSQIIDLPGI